MEIALENFSTITAKGQTTIPKAVRQALGVSCGGRIVFRVSNSGVTLAPAALPADSDSENSETDPAIGWRDHRRSRIVSAYSHDNYQWLDASRAPLISGPA